MKKLHLIAAAAALLLSGGVFVKVNNTNFLLSKNIEAFSEDGEGSSGLYCVWEQTGHAPNWSYVILTCFGSVYPDRSKPGCDCSRMGETITQDL